MAPTCCKTRVLFRTQERSWAGVPAGWWKFLDVSDTVVCMEDSYDRDDLARRLSSALSRQFKGNKRAAYTAAGVSPQTFDRALDGLAIRDDTRHSIESMLAGDGYVSAPGQTLPGGVTEDDVLAAIAKAREMMDAFERQQLGRS